MPAYWGFKRHFGMGVSWISCWLPGSGFWGLGETVAVSLQRRRQRGFGESGVRCPRSKVGQGLAS